MTEVLFSLYCTDCLLLQWMRRGIGVVICIGLKEPFNYWVPSVTAPIAENEPLLKTAQLIHQGRISGWIHVSFKCHQLNEYVRAVNTHRWEELFCLLILLYFTVIFHLNVQTDVRCMYCGWAKWIQRAWCEPWERRCCWDRWHECT